ncbi:hypothetical protein [Acidovorax sp.]|uniref:hypothetical protein n=1 Tax=Acidovorax sp. TaxID=1872122 RepID=UPI00391EEF10
MNELFGWALRNLSLPIGMAVLTACAAGLYQSTEVDAQQYRVLRQSYLDGTSRYQANLAGVANGGAVSKWAYTALLRDFWTDASSLSAPGPDDAPGVDAARAELMAQIKSNGGT